MGGGRKHLAEHNVDWSAMRQRSAWTIDRMKLSSSWSFQEGHSATQSDTETKAGDKRGADNVQQSLWRQIARGLGVLSIIIAGVAGQGGGLEHALNVVEARV